MCGDQLGTLEGGFPFTLAAGDEDHFARLVGEAIERLLARVVAAPFLDSRARIGSAPRPTTPPSSAPVGATRSGFRLRHALAISRSMRAESGPSREFSPFNFKTSRETGSNST